MAQNETPRRGGQCQPRWANCEYNAMAQSFRLENPDSDATLTIVLLAVMFGLSLVNVWIRVPPITLHPMPVFAFFLTRWAYKRHYRRLLETQSMAAIED